DVFFQAKDGIRDRNVTGVQTCALPISAPSSSAPCTYSTAPRVRSATTSAPMSRDRVFPKRLGSFLRRPPGRRRPPVREGCAADVSSDSVLFLRCPAPDSGGSEGDTRLDLSSDVRPAHRRRGPDRVRSGLGPKTPNDREGRSVRDPIGASDAPGPYSWSSSELPPLRTTSSKTYWTEFMETTFTVARSDSSPGGSPSTLADQNTAR